MYWLKNISILCSLASALRPRSGPAPSLVRVLLRIVREMGRRAFARSRLAPYRQGDGKTLLSCIRGPYYATATTTSIGYLYHRLYYLLCELPLGVTHHRIRYDVCNQYKDTRV